MSSGNQVNYPGSTPGNILLLGWLYDGFCSGTDFQPIVVLYSAVGDFKEIPFLDQSSVV